MCMTHSLRQYERSLLDKDAKPQESFYAHIDEDLGSKEEQPEDEDIEYFS